MSSLLAASCLVDGSGSSACVGLSSELGPVGSMQPSIPVMAGGQEKVSPDAPVSRHRVCWALGRQWMGSGKSQATTSGFSQSLGPVSLLVTPGSSVFVTDFPTLLIMTKLLSCPTQYLPDLRPALDSGKIQIWVQIWPWTCPHHVSGSGERDYLGQGCSATISTAFLLLLFKGD